jgi:signal transduction histidine kinase
MNFQRIVTAVILMIFGVAGHSQRDSLWQLVWQARQDTAEVMWLIELGEAYELTQPDSAIIIYNRARDLSLQIGYPLGYARYANAVAYPLELLDKLDEKDSILYVAIDLCKKHGFRRELARKYHSLGVSEQMRRNYQQASEHYLTGLSIADDLRDTLLFTAFYNNLGSVFKGLGRNDKAYEYISKALSIHRTRGKRSGIASAQLNLGIIDLRNKDYDTALIRFREALQISKELNDYEGILISNLNISDVYLGTGRFEETLPMLDTAYKYAQQLGAERYRMIVIQAKASAMKLLKRPSEAIDLLDEAEHMAKALDEKERLSTIYLDKSDIYESLGEFQNALIHLRLAHAYQDSVANEDIENNVNELEAKYAAAKREKELLEKDVEIQRQNADKRFRGILLGASGFLILLLVVVLLQRQKINREKLANTRREQQLELVSLREQERSRIASDMHDDIGSGLTSIRLLSEIAMRKGKDEANIVDLHRISERATQMVQKMSEIIWALNPGNDSLFGLISYTRSQMSTFADEAGIRLLFADSTGNRQIAFKSETRRNIYLIISEVVNNSIKYSGANEIRISFDCIGDQLIVVVADNGIFQKKDHHTGQGIANMHKRAKAIGADVTIKTSFGTEICLVINLYGDQQ